MSNLLTKKRLILLWAEQCGLAHVDWEHDEELAALRTDGLFIGGLAAFAAEMCTTIQAVLWVGEQFLKQNGAESANK